MREGNVPFRLSHYEILEEIGRGGMGVVYRARDTELRRDVALKVLPEAFVADRERLARFEREARVLAALNHPGIATIHELGRDGATHFLVMELVLGEDLAQRLSRSVLSLDEVLKLFPQIAEALEAAHGQGVVHRDLKPANVMITPDGRVKLLDFGLAKPVETPAEQDPSLSPTLTREGTATGVILGTASYMSPEQALGKPVDRRTDVWAFGCVLYEALCGRKAFPGATVVETLASVLRREPDWDALPAEMPLALRTLLHRCFRTDPGRRLHDVADARIVLEESLDSRDGLQAPIRSPGSRSLWIAPVILAGAVGAFLWSRDQHRAADPLRLSILAPEGTEFPRLEIPVVAPDGSRIVFVARDGDGAQHLWVRELSSFSARLLAGTAGASHPFFSPRAEQVGFFANGKLQTVDLASGQVRSLADADLPRGGSWGADDTILYAPTRSSALFAVSSRGGPARQLTELDPMDLSHRYPQFLPDGRRFVYRCSGCEKGGVWMGSLDPERPHRFLGIESRAQFVPPGFLVFFSDEGWLVAQSFDVDRGELLGEPVPLSESPEPEWREGLFSISSSGVLVYPRETPFTRRLVLYDRDGTQLETVGTSGDFGSPAFSPDGGRIAFFYSSNNFFEIWIHDFGTNTGTRIDRGRAPVWSPGGAEVSFSRGRDVPGIYRTQLASEEAARLVVAAQTPNTFATDWSHGEIVYMRQNDERERTLDLWAISLRNAEGAEPFPIVQSEGTDAHGQVSPDGNWLAYSSSRGDAGIQVYVQRFPDATEWFQISQSGGLQPTWSRDGSELYFMTATGVIMVVAVELGRELRYETPRKLFQTKIDPDAFTSMRNAYDVSPDGERFVVVEPSEEAAVRELRVVANWKSLLSAEAKR